MINLRLDEAEAAAVAVALVGLIHDPKGGRFVPHAVVVAERLRRLRARRGLQSRVEDDGETWIH